MSSLDARSLFAAAREDGPDAAERDVVFRKIALATGVAAGTAAGVTALSALPSAPALVAGAAAAEASTSAGAAASTSAATGGAFGMKLLALGAVLGAASMALGVILALTLVTPEPTRAAARSGTAVTPASAMPGAKLAQPAARKRDPDANANANANAAASATATADTKTSADESAKSKASASAAGASAAGASGGDLAEEARLVTAARSALMAGDAARALALVQSTRKWRTRSLEPEELGLEARALRALGRADDAAVTELVLRRRYPDHALAR